MMTSGNGEPESRWFAPLLTKLRRHEHLTALGLYLLLSLLLSWPTVAHFTTALTSSGGDARHELYLLWHTQQALLGKQPLFSAPLLYYPLGATLLTHSTGPVTGLFALPFWLLGPAAAFNGTLLVSLVLSGFAMFLLGREVGLRWGVALFAGCFVLAAPMTLAGLPEHLTKVFTAGLPLALLALQRALDPQRRWRWSLLAGLSLLFVLLHNGYQFVYICLAYGLISLITLVLTPRTLRRIVLGRIALTALCAIVLCGPLLFAILRAAADPALGVAVNPKVTDAPDLLQFILPDQISFFFGNWIGTLLQPTSGTLLIDHETAVALPWVGVLLAGLALFGPRRRVLPWLLLWLCALLFALGPVLRVYGQAVLIAGQPLNLPYSYLRQLPGLEFMRTPGRFMQIGVIGLGLSAGFGLEWLLQVRPRWHRWLLIGTPLLLLIQIWPRPFPSERLRPIPPFYQQIANDPELYGVFDLPVKPAAGFSFGLAYQHTSSIYQIYQMTHGKGIAGGYLSRTYLRHPLFETLLSFNTEPMPALLVNGQTAAFSGFQDELAQHNYRYVVLHKDETQPPALAFAPGYTLSQQLLAVAFAGQPPLVDDALTTVYQVRPKPTLHIRLGTGWRAPEKEWRWATSPATLEITSPVTQTVQLQLTPVYLHDPQSPNGLGERGELTVQVGTQPGATMPLIAGQPGSITLDLRPGQQTVTLSLAAGNFQPKQYGGQDAAWLSFAVRAIDLRMP